MSKRKKFRRYNSYRKKRLRDNWRRPRGLHNKMRRHIAAKGRMVKVGYGSNPAEKNIHPCGLRERLVFNVKDLETIKEEAIRISSGVGKRKRAEIKERAEEIGLKVLNP